MKKILVVFAAICIMSMGACFSPWDGSGDQGTIVIDLGDSGARAAADGDGYTAILTGSGGAAMSQTITGGKASFSVQPGLWNVAVRRANSAGRLNGYGEKSNVEVKAGATASASIDLRNLIEVGGEWNNLKEAIEGGQAELVMLTSETLTVNDSIEIPHGKSITLLAETKVTIIKGNNFPNSMFRVPRGSSLTLGVAGGMGGTITFDGDGKGNSSLIYVGTTRLNNSSDNTGDGGKLTMYDGVILTNNIANVSTNDRGGAVVVQGGTFNMYGGEISRNKNTANGGGVRVLSGTLTKTGGTIYGSDGGENSNTAVSGHAVYFDSSNKAIDTTLGPKNNL